MDVTKKRLIQWETGQHEGKGIFKTKCDKALPGAINFSGETTKKVKYDYYALVARNLSGKLRWIDKIEGKFQTTIKVIVESEKGFHEINFYHNVNNLSDVLGPLKVLGKKIIDTPISFSYAILDKKDKNGNFVLNDNKEVKKVKRIFIQAEGNTVQQFFNQEKNPKPKDLEWVKTKTPKGVDYDNSKEMIFWENSIVALQEFLINSGVAVPLSYGSVLCTSTELGYEGGKIISADLLKKSEEMRKAVSERIIFPYATKQTNADDVFDVFENYSSSPANSSSDDYFANITDDDTDPFATDLSFAEDSSSTADDSDDDDLGLPF
jgi:hypothetical protein